MIPGPSTAFGIGGNLPDDNKACTRSLRDKFGRVEYHDLHRYDTSLGTHNLSLLECIIKLGRMEPFPEEIRQFVELNIESIDQLEILRVLNENPDKECDAAFLAAEIQANPKAIGIHLAALHGRGLLLAEKRVDWFGRHGAHTPELKLKVDRLLQTYHERPVSMIKFIYSQANNPLRVFAEAFQLRKKGS